MTIRKIVLLPDPLLKKTCEAVEQVDASIRSLVEDMFETMTHYDGIGLAANQVGELKRVIVLNVPIDEEGSTDRRVLINPEILWHSDGTDIKEEGCLSLPDYRQDVNRPNEIEIRYLDENGVITELEADGLLARCIQHEIDHLNGKLILDYLSKLKREMKTKKLVKMYAELN